ncbi:MAG TPA: AmmeMemoRadiSam system radical SAM enzyme [Synergistetes bacterium]|nr:AmmeMemoRadiSam system radical SAM enzyme [Synergistota bacterium]
MTEKTPWTSARYWKREGNAKENTRCLLCPRSCLIKPGERGVCLTRLNKEGELLALNYGYMCAAVDPVEKKPFFHWRPGTEIFSVGSFGCNLFCPFCQNAHLSRFGTPAGLHYVSPKDLVSLVQKAGYPSVAFTYNEPVVWYEFVMDVSILLQRNRMDTVLVTNGFISPDPLEELLDVTMAMNIDLKGFYPRTYEKSVGSVEPVLHSIERALEKGVHLEITHLVVPGINDSLEEFNSMIKWIGDHSRYIPLHISRYFPSWQWDKPPTSLEEIRIRKEIAMDHLHFVYTGNTGEMNYTFCPSCGKEIITRHAGRPVKIFVTPEGKCPFCNTSLGIVTR